MTAPTTEQAHALALAADDAAGIIIRHHGGYWTAGESEYAEGTRAGRDKNWVGTATAFACRSRGWLAPSDGARGDRVLRITLAGRNALQSLGAP